MEFFRADWSRNLAFTLFAIWLFSFLLWDFILAVLKQYEMMKKGDSAVGDLKREVLCFVGACIFIGWGLWYLYKWFEQPDLTTWLVAGAVLALAAWVNKSLRKRWLYVPFEEALQQKEKTDDDSDLVP